MTKLQTLRDALGARQLDAVLLTMCSPTDLSNRCFQKPYHARAQINFDLSGIDGKKMGSP
jgi:hypothetical protein